MDYKKLYEEALERAKKIVKGENNWGYCDMTEIKPAVEEIFPELRESEDERIRKEIQDIVLSYRSNCVYEGNHHFDECLAWLEKKKESTDESDKIAAAYQLGLADGRKQKEQKCHTIIKGWVARDKALQLNFYSNKPKRGKTYWIENGGDSVQIMPDPENLYEETEFDTLTWEEEPIEVELFVRRKEQKEQKPVCGGNFKWTSQDERCRGKLIDVLELADAAYPTTKDSRDELWEWLKELPMKFPNKNAFITGILDDDYELSPTEEILGVDGNPACYKQKPAETPSNLDELLDDYFANLQVPDHQIIFENTYRKIATDFYGYGRSEKPNNHTEWSEEDEKNLHWLCMIIHTKMLEKVISLKEESELGKWIDKWLNHEPNNHWKPSEEQMNALSYAIQVMSTDLSPRAAKAAEELESIAKQLKAL